MVSHETDFHQFMLYTPVPGTPLYSEMRDSGRLIDVNLADIHGQDKFNFQHAAISREDSNRFLGNAFQRDFDRNGPSLYRICRTTMQGWKRYKNYADPRVRSRFEWETRTVKTAYSTPLWAMEKQMDGAAVKQQIRELRNEIGREFGFTTRVLANVLGPFLWWTSRGEQWRLQWPNLRTQNVH